MMDKLSRAFACLLAWSLPIVGNRVGLMLAPARPEEAGVNMWGLTSEENTAALIGTAVGVAAAVWLIFAARLGWLWLLVAVGVIAAVGFLLNLLDVPGGSTVGVVLLIIAPIVGALVTARPARRPSRA